MRNIPMKMMIADCFSRGEALNDKAVLDMICERYPRERYCRLATVREHLMSLKAVGILNDESSYLDDDETLISVYRISEYGLNRLRKAHKAADRPCGKRLAEETETT